MARGTAPQGSTWKPPAAQNSPCSVSSRRGGRGTAGSLPRRGTAASRAAVLRAENRSPAGDRYNGPMSDPRLPRVHRPSSTRWISLFALVALLLGGFAAVSASDAAKEPAAPPPQLSHDHHQHLAAATKPAAPATASRAAKSTKPAAA